MLIQVLQTHFDQAAEVLPEDAPTWMRQEFAANFALKQRFPEASVIKVDATGIEIDGRRFQKPLVVYLRRRPYVFKLGRSRWLVRLYDAASLLFGWK